MADLRTFAVSKQMERPLMSSESRTNKLGNILRTTVILSSKVIDDLTGEHSDWKWRMWKWMDHLEFAN